MSRMNTGASQGRRRQRVRLTFEQWKFWQRFNMLPRDKLGA
ncbi:hypothetical protein [Paraburkholderia sediminicola]